MHQLHPDKSYLGLVFFATLFIYSIHRIIGIKRLPQADSDGRYGIIYRFQNHIIIYGFIGLAGLLWMMTRVGTNTILLLLPAGICSLLYVLPILSHKRRLRDINYIKIFLIAFTWSYIAIIPILEDAEASYTWISFIEKFFFMLAITLPFDIRDSRIDKLTSLKTLPSQLGNSSTYKLAYTLLAIAGLLFCYQHTTGAVTWSYAIIYIVTAICIWISCGKKSDYYFSGLLDGTLVLRGAVIYLVSLVIS